MRKTSEAFQPPRLGGGAKGIRTPDLYNANVARYQLCYSPLFGNFSDHILHLVGFRCLRGGSAQVVVRSTNCANAPFGKFPCRIIHLTTLRLNWLFSHQLGCGGLPTVLMPHVFRSLYSVSLILGKCKGKKRIFC